MADLSSLSTGELADRIAILRDNIRQITEQAASQSGAADEERNAERLARLNDELESLIKEQERRPGR
jgi:ABC-type transporter Mla subunit MlaD